MFVEQLIEFLRRWNETRSLRRIALLAILLAVLPLIMCALVVWGYSTSVNTLANRHIQLVEARLDSPDVDESSSEFASELYVPLNRILQLGQSNERVTHIVAIQLFRQGRIAEAVRKFREIAPVGGRGYPPAHLFLADIDGQSLESVLNDLAVADSSLSTMPPQVTQRYVELLVRNGKDREALAVLRLRAEQTPELNLTLAEVAAKVGDRNETRLAVGRFREVVESQYEENELDERYFLIQVTLAELMGEPGELSEALGQGLAMFPDSRPLRRKKSDLFLAEAVSAASGVSGAHTGTDIGTLQKAMNADPTSPGVINRIAHELSRGTQLPNEMLKVLRASLDAGTAPSDSHFALSLGYLRRGTPEGAKAAIANIELGIKKQNGVVAPAILNNFAFACLELRPPRTAAALEVLDLALQVKRLPRDQLASIYDTQGQARAMAGDELGAIESYENAIELVGAKLNSRASLAELYAKHGMTELAVAQRERIDALKRDAERN